jgi:nucleoside-diphosphate-sugar epimerase
MLGNLLDMMESAPAFANIHLMQGMKYYGSNFGPFKTPAKEDDPRVAGCEVYYAEEDLVMRRQQGARWTWTALRPHAVCGYAAANPMNLATILAVYGAILRESGEEFRFPGTEAGFNSLFQLVDSELLARAAIYVATTPGCGNKAYNINNGDLFRWKHMWPALAAFFGLRPAGPANTLLADFLAQKQPAWEAIAAKYQLAPFPFERAPRWVKGDYSGRNSRLACEHDIIGDTLRLRRAGFTEVLDSETMFLQLFERFRAERIIP